jgi:hypothetical protein
MCRTERFIAVQVAIAGQLGGELHASGFLSGIEPEVLQEKHVTGVHGVDCGDGGFVHAIAAGKEDVSTQQGAEVTGDRLE